ncbi:hypothetical protein [Neorhodopirellula pilleata]|uniref:Uncharacterized protein n=1 Tax=Neorhodopirellula pilleata TaxID=2714738 RepID=A0A5C6ASB2_9BACT|nr:hypothetical protein [Neorhodopirellula pilleata]TWU01976.1 hypothetical protein Pla100_17120 [Neorhodopirellula pilleata]
MYRLVFLSFVMASAFVIGSSSPVISAPTAMASEVVSYRCPEWKTRHEHDSKQAAQIVDTLKKLKCEVEKHEHNGHIDIKYRCPKWLEHQAKTHDDAHKLMDWLKALKFEVKHQH